MRNISSSGERRCWKVIFGAALACVAMAACMLVMPGEAKALSSFTIDGNTYYNGTPASSGDGTWTYDGDMQLVLSDYNGGNIEARGNIWVTLMGQNKVTSNSTTPINVSDGNLTLYVPENGSGSLSTESSIGGIKVTGGDLRINHANVDVTIKDSSEPTMPDGLIVYKGSLKITDGSWVTVQTLNSTCSWASGASVTKSTGDDANSGNILIDNSTFEANIAASKYAAGLSIKNRSADATKIEISNGSTIDITASGTGGSNAVAYGIGAFSSTTTESGSNYIFIKDSLVTAMANCSEEPAEEDDGSYGIYCEGLGTGSYASIDISSSQVAASGSRFAMASICNAGWNETAEFPGVMAITGCSISGPTNGTVRDFDASISFPEMGTSVYAGQLVGTAGTSTITSFNDSQIAHSVSITKGGSVIPVTEVTLAPFITDALEVGDFVQFNATVKPDNATDKTLVWSTDNPAVATINQNGLAIATGNGIAKVYARSNTGNIYASSIVIVGAQDRGRLIRLEGETRIETMAKVVKKTFPDKADTVIVAAAWNYPDALAASALAGATNAPIILTDTDVLSDAAMEQIERLEPSQAIIVGGDAAVGLAVEDTLKLKMGEDNVKRFFGDGRVETSLEIYKKGMSELGIDWGSTAIITTGWAYADALSSSPYAYTEKAPIFLVGSDGLSDSQITELENGGFTRTIVLGGEAAVTAGTYQQLVSLNLNPIRIEGETRIETSQNFSAWALANSSLSIEYAVFATGWNYADALSAGPMAGSRHSLLLLLDPSGSSAVDFFEGIGRNPDIAYIIGGEAAVSYEAEGYIADKLNLSTAM